MIKTRTSAIVLALLLTILLSSCLSLAEDITPPPGAEQPPPIQQNTPPPQPTAEINIPETKADPSHGASIYAEKCAPCHGESGLGDGPDAASLDNPVPALGSADLARQATLSDWYTMVTRGNMPNFMPPFSSLTDIQRWDVVAYAYTLSAPEEFILLGQALFLENCSECHGEDGSKGDIDFTDHILMSNLSAADLFSAISSGQGEMPSFDELDVDDRWALTAYMHSLTFTSEEVSAVSEISEGETETQDSSSPSEIPSESPDDGFANILIKIVNGTSGTELPPNLEVTLRGYDNMTEAYTQTLKTNNDHQAFFKDVPMPDDRLYFATTEFGNATFGSAIHTIAEDVDTNELEITFYQPTSDASILRVDRLHIFIDFVDEETIEIFQLYIFSNPSDRVLVPDQKNQPAVKISIPEEAANFNVEQNMGMMYMDTAEGFGIVSVYPDTDQYQTLFSFQLPYNKKLDLVLPIGMDADAIIVMVPDNGIKVKSNQLTEMGAQSVEGASFNMYSGSNLDAGSTLAMVLSGRPKTASTNIISNLEENNNSLVIGLAGFGIALVAAGVYLWRRNQVTSDEWLNDEIEFEPIKETPENIMDAIITLDDQYKNGELPEGAYRQRRAELKKQLRELVAN